MQRRELFQLAIAIPALAACRGSEPAHREESKLLTPIRTITIPDDIEPAMTFVPLRK